MKDLAPALAVLTPSDQAAIVALAEELRDTWQKRQVFRTETEMRFSVLDDGTHPTPAAKYWQAVREQAIMLDNLVALSFEMRRNDVKRAKLEAQLAAAPDALHQQELQIDLEEAAWQRATMEQVANDRVREILLWSKLKAECNDGSFDTTNVNTHQAESYHLALQNRLQSLTPGSSQAEVLNVLGPLHTLGRLQEEGVLSGGTMPAERLLRAVK
jgi:hypothetical protein